LIKGLIRPRFSFSEAQPGKCKWNVMVASMVFLKQNAIATSYGIEIHKKAD